MSKPDFAVAPEDYALLFEAIKKQNEPLHPDLLPYLEESSFPMLRHPLIYQVPFFSGGQANYQYEAKKKYVAEALEKKNYSQFIFLHERPYRVEAFLEIESLLTDKQYWELLSSIYTDTENAWAYLSQYKKLFSSQRSHREYLMDEEERKVYEALPDEVTVYRGYQVGQNRNGISWTTSKKTAQWFATRFAKQGKVLEKRVPKRDIISVFNGRNESEVVIL